jgi:biopolymer transport protein ExbB
MSNFLHDISFYIMYGASALAVFVIVERMIFFVFNTKKAVALAKQAAQGSSECLELALKEKSSVASELVQNLVQASQRFSGSDLEAAGDAALIAAKGKLQHRLWMLDTIVTAAPLLGLLGTILGIVETFYSLAQSGMSDPAGVSSGIGTALYATALGIGIAVVGLMFFNLFQERVERITDSLKVTVLQLSMSADAKS